MTRCEPLEFPKNLVEYQSYKKDIDRWARVCGIEPEIQAETILMKIPKSNIFKAQLDNALADRCIGNKDGVKLILKTMDRLLGTDEDLEDFDKVIRLLQLKRSPHQNILEFITQFDTLRSEVALIKDLDIPDRIFAFLFLFLANPPVVDKKMAFNELKAAKKNIGKDEPIPENFYTDNFFRSLRNIETLQSLGQGKANKTYVTEEAAIEQCRAISAIRPAVVGSQMENNEYDKIKDHLKEIMIDVENYSVLLKTSLVEIEKKQADYNDYILPNAPMEEDITNLFKSFGLIH